MNDHLVHYIRRHMVMTVSVLVVGIALLAIGEFYLYKQIMFVNQMVSEGFMQVKEMQQPQY